MKGCATGANSWPGDSIARPDLPAKPRVLLHNPVMVPVDYAAAALQQEGARGL
jgi:hypothetical protein